MDLSCTRLPGVAAAPLPLIARRRYRHHTFLVRLDLIAKSVGDRMPDLLERPHDRAATTPATNPGRQPREATQDRGEATGEHQKRQTRTHATQPTPIVCPSPGLNHPPGSARSARQSNPSRSPGAAAGPPGRTVPLLRG